MGTTWGLTYKYIGTIPLSVCCTLYSPAKSVLNESIQSPGQMEELKTGWRGGGWPWDP